MLELIELLCLQEFQFYNTTRFKADLVKGRVKAGPDGVPVFRVSLHSRGPSGEGGGPDLREVQRPSSSSEVCPGFDVETWPLSRIASDLCPPGRPSADPVFTLQGCLAADVFVLHTSRYKPHFCNYHIEPESRCHL